MTYAIDVVRKTLFPLNDVVIYEKQTCTLKIHFFVCNDLTNILDVYAVFTVSPDTQPFLDGDTRILFYF
jgi:hypothetical protein